MADEPQSLDHSRPRGLPPSQLRKPPSCVQKSITRCPDQVQSPSEDHCKLYFMSTGMIYFYLFYLHSRKKPAKKKSYFQHKFFHLLYVASSIDGSQQAASNVPKASKLALPSLCTVMTSFRAPLPCAHAASEWRKDF